MSSLLFVHLLCAAVWLGCILVEVVFERSVEPTPPSRLFISRLHWNVDRVVEVPALAGVLVTGGTMASHARFAPMLTAKVALGLVAILANLVCVVLVVRRLRLARAGDMAGWERVDHLQHKMGAVVLLALIAALVLGGSLLAGG